MAVQIKLKVTSYLNNKERKYDIQNSQDWISASGRYNNKWNNIFQDAPVWNLCIVPARKDKWRNTSIVFIQCVVRAMCVCATCVHDECAFVKYTAQEDQLPNEQPYKIICQMYNPKRSSIKCTTLQDHLSNVQPYKIIHHMYNPTR